MYIGIYVCIFYIYIYVYISKSGHILETLVGLKCSFRFCTSYYISMEWKTTFHQTVRLFKLTHVFHCYCHCLVYRSLIRGILSFYGKRKSLEYKFLCDHIIRLMLPTVWTNLLSVAFDLKVEAGTLLKLWHSLPE